MQSATRQSEAAASQSAELNSAHTAKRAKLSVLLVTGDDLLWPQIGAHLSSEMVLKQVDSVDELLTTTPAGQSAIVLWDARGLTDAATVLSRLQLHSPCFAVVALDDPGSAAVWTNPIALRQIIAQVAIPVLPEELRAAIDSGREEVAARTALLGGDGMHGAASPGAAAHGGAMPPVPSARQSPWLPAAIIAGVLIAAVGTFLLVRHSGGVKPAPPASPIAAPQPAGKASAAADEKVDLLIEKAQQAMLERHFIDPADSSALALYRRALVLDPDNGEAHQGLQRLAEILIARVQSALDERKFDLRPAVARERTQHRSRRWAAGRARRAHHELARRARPRADSGGDQCPEFRSRGTTARRSGAQQIARQCQSGAAARRAAAKA